MQIGVQRVTIEIIVPEGAKHNFVMALVDSLINLNQDKEIEITRLTEYYGSLERTA